MTEAPSADSMTLLASLEGPKVDHKATRLEMFGPVGDEHFADAINATHRFAQATGCPPGGDVIQWLAAKCEEWSERCSEAYRLRATQSRSTAEDGKGG